jgi:outer membrane receptor protein involved in Fe transport
MKLSHPVSLVLVFAATFMLFPVPLSAQESDAAAEVKVGKLEEVVVTARKREENLQEVPVAVTAFTADTLRDFRINNAEDVAAYTPGFSFIRSFGRDSDRPVIRGMSNILGAANASFFVDGVYVPGTIASTELQMLERVEVIKGPQAALYGRATFSGAVNYVTRRPTNEREAELSASVAEHDQTDITGYISGAIVPDSFYYYLGASYYSYGGEYTNTLDGRKVGGEETTTLTGKFVWSPSESFDATLRVTYQEDDDDHIALWLQGAEYNNCLLPSNDPSSFRPAARGYYCGVVRTNDTVNLRTDFLPNPGIERDILRTALTLEWDLAGGHTLTSVTGFQTEETGRQIDVSYAAYDPLNYVAYLAVVDLNGQFWRVQKEEDESFSQEIRISSPQDRRFRWSLGAYYYDSTFDRTVDDRMNPRTSYPSQWNAANAQQQNNAATFSAMTENTAIFGSIEYDFTDKLRGTFEARYASEKLTREEFTYYPAPFFAPSGGGKVDETFDSVTPRASLTWLSSDTITVYASVAKGNKPGGFNALNAPQVAYDEEEAWNYELGVKATLMDGAMAWNTALFFIDWTDQQLTQNAILPDGTLGSYIINVGKTEVTGLETELTWMITDRWSLSANYAWIDSEIKEFITVDQALFFGCNPTSNPTEYFNCIQQYGSVAGNKSPRSSPHQASLRTMYNFPMNNGREWFLGADIAYEGSRYAQVHNLAETGDATRVGVQAGLRTNSWDFTLWVKNLFDDDTAQDILRYIDYREYTFANEFPCRFIPPFQGFPFDPNANCGPFSARGASNIGGGPIGPRGFAITLPRGRQFGATLRFRF